MSTARSINVETAGARLGISRMVVAVVIIVILVGAGAIVFLARGPSTGNSSQTSSTSPSAPVENSVNQLVHDLNNRDVDGVIGFYSSNAIVVWSGKADGLVGNFQGPANIRLLYATSVGKATKMNANVSNYAEKVFSPTHVNTTFGLVMLANSTVAGVVNATVNVSEEWNWGNGTWNISRENWAYKYFDASFLDAQIGSATTFPQWGVIAKGGNPNLVSEKSFEWQAGPLLAAAVYGFLFSVLTILALKLRSNRRDSTRAREITR